MPFAIRFANPHHMNCLAKSAQQRLCRSIHHSFFSTTSSIIKANATKSNIHTAHVRSALSAGPLPYERGWAWQHVLLNRRLTHMRQQQKKLQQQQQSDEQKLMIATTPTSETSTIQRHDHHDSDWILLFEHTPVYTLGRGATEDYLTFLNTEPDGGVEKKRRLCRKYRGHDASRLNIDKSLQNVQFAGVEEEVNHHSNSSIHSSVPPVLAPNGSPIYRIERGGEVTYHGPGQLVMYPLLNLKQPVYEQDLHWYLRQIEQVIIQTLSEFNIQSNRDSINTGVWVGQNKIAAVGVSSSRWITTHGLALNVAPNLEHFDKDIMVPCGIEGRGVTSIAKELGESECPSVMEVADVALRQFSEVFGVQLTSGNNLR